MLTCTRCSRKVGKRHVGYQDAADQYARRRDDYDADRDGPLVICDFCFVSGGRVCPDCGGAHFDTYRINSSRCTSCLDALSHNAESLAHDIVRDKRVARDGTVDTTGLNDHWTKAEIRMALSFVKMQFALGEIEFDPV